MNKKEEANALVKESITIALLYLMREKSFEEITITELVKTAGVCRASFYRNYTGKEDVIYKFLQTLLDEWRKSYSKNVNTGSCGYQNLIESLLRHYYDNKDIYLFLYQSGLSDMILNHLVYECGPKPEYEDKSAYAHACFAYGLYGCVSEWLKRGMKETPEELAETYHSFSVNLAKYSTSDTKNS